MFPGLYIPYGQFKVVCGGKTVAVETMVDVPAKIPTEHEVSVAVAIGIGVQDVLVDRRHGFEGGWGEFPVQFVEHPGNGASGNKFGGHDAIAYFAADEFQFGIWVYHRVCTLIYGSIRHPVESPFPMRFMKLK